MLSGSLVIEKSLKISCRFLWNLFLQENCAFDFKQTNRYTQSLIQIQIIQFLQFEPKPLHQMLDSDLCFFSSEFYSNSKYRIQWTFKSSLQSEKLPHATIDPSLSGTQFFNLVLAPGTNKKRMSNRHCKSLGPVHMNTVKQSQKIPSWIEFFMLPLYSKLIP